MSILFLIFLSDKYSVIRKFLPTSLVILMGKLLEVEAKLED